MECDDRVTRVDWSVLVILNDYPTIRTHAYHISFDFWDPSKMDGMLY